MRLGFAEFWAPRFPVLSTRKSKVSNPFVSVHSKRRPLEPTRVRDDHAVPASREPRPDTTPVAIRPEGACLGDECVLTDYADALEKLWRP